MSTQSAFWGPALHAVHLAHLDGVTALPDGVKLALAATGLDNQTLYRWLARVLYALFSVTQPGVTSPPNPAHGPWRRYSGQVEEVDVRTSGETRLFLPLVKRDRCAPKKGRLQAEEGTRVEDAGRVPPGFESLHEV